MLSELSEHFLINLISIYKISLPNDKLTTVYVHTVILNDWCSECICLNQENSQTPHFRKSFTSYCTCCIDVMFNQSSNTCHLVCIVDTFFPLCRGSPDLPLCWKIQYPALMSLSRLPWALSFLTRIAWLSWRIFLIILLATWSAKASLSSLNRGKKYGCWILICVERVKIVWILCVFHWRN